MQNTLILSKPLLFGVFFFLVVTDLICFFAFCCFIFYFWTFCSLTYVPLKQIIWHFYKRHGKFDFVLLTPSILELCPLICWETPMFLRFSYNCFRSYQETCLKFMQNVGHHKKQAAFNFEILILLWIFVPWFKKNKQFLWFPFKTTLVPFKQSFETY